MDKLRIFPYLHLTENNKSCLAGIGYGGQLILLYSCMTYIIILSWALLYLVFSFSSQLPWANCNNYWNSRTVKCRMCALVKSFQTDKL